MTDNSNGSYFLIDNGRLEGKVPGGYQYDFVTEEK
jgi:hypothetical protein